MADELAFPTTTADTGTLYAEHRNTPAWGRGKVLRTFNGKIEIAFPKTGTKVFRADAPFLRLS